MAFSFLALGIVAALALPALAAGFAWRASHGFGVAYAAESTRTFDLGNATRVEIRGFATKPEATLAIEYVRGGATLAYRGERIVNETATGQACEGERGPTCARNMTFAFVIPGPFDAAWSMDGSAVWRSAATGLASAAGVSAHGVGPRVER